MDLVLHPGLKVKELNEEELREFANLQDRLLEKLRAQLLAQTSIPYQDVQNEAQRILQEYAEQSTWFDQSGEPMRQKSRRRRSVVARRITRPTVQVSQAQRLRNAPRPVPVVEEDKSLTDSNSGLHTKKKKRYDSKLRNYPRPWAEINTYCGPSSAGGRRSASSIPSDLSTLALPPLSVRSSLSVLSEVYINVPVSSSDYFDDVFTKRHESRYYQQHVDVQKPKDSDSSGGTESPLPPGYLKRIVLPWVDPKTAQQATETEVTDTDEDEVTDDVVDKSSESAVEASTSEPKLGASNTETSQTHIQDSENEEPELVDKTNGTEIVTESETKPSSVSEPLPDTIVNSKSSARNRSRSKKKRRKLVSTENYHPPAGVLPVAKEPFRPAAGKAKAKDRHKTIEATSPKKKVLERPLPLEITVNHVTLPEEPESKSAKSTQNVTSTDKSIAIRRSKNELKKVYKAMVSFNNFENVMNDLIDERNSGTTSCVEAKDGQGKLNAIALTAIPSDMNRNTITTAAETTIAFMKVSSNTEISDNTRLDTRDAITRAQTTVSYCSDLELSQSNLYLPSIRYSTEKTSNTNTKLVNETEAVTSTCGSSVPTEKVSPKENVQSTVGKPVLFDEPTVKAQTIISRSGLFVNKRPPLSRRSLVERITPEIEISTRDSNIDTNPGADKSSPSDSEHWDDSNRNLSKEALRIYIRKPVVYDDHVVPASATIARSGMLTKSRSRPSLIAKPSSRAILVTEIKAPSPQCNSSFTVIPKIVSPRLSKSNVQHSNILTLSRKPAESKLVECPIGVATLLSTENFRIKLSDGSTRIKKLSLVSPTTDIPALKQRVHTDIDLPIVKVKRSSSMNLQQKPESFVKIGTENLPAIKPATKVSEETPAPVPASNTVLNLDSSPKRTYELLPRVATKSLLKLAKASIKRRESFTKVCLNDLLPSNSSNEGEVAIQSTPTGAVPPSVLTVESTKKSKVIRLNDESSKPKKHGKFRGKIQLGFAEVLKYNISDYKFHDSTPANMIPVVRLMASKTKSNVRQNPSTESTVRIRSKQFTTPAPSFNCWKGSVAQRLIDTSNFQRQKVKDDKEAVDPSNSKSIKPNIESTSAGTSDNDKSGRNRSRVLKSVTHGWNIS